MANLRWGRVAAVHPEDYSVDLVMMDDGTRLAGVQVLSPSASSSTGFNDLPSPASPSSGNVWDLREKTERDVLAAVLSFNGQFPVVIGFRFPQINQMLFKEEGRRVVRHDSDVYSTIDAAGNMELCHPSGTYVRIGTSPAHEDLTGKDFDKQWKIAKNTGKPVHLQVTIANGGTEMASINIDPSGNLNVSLQGKANIDVTGTADVTAGGAATVKAPEVTLDTPETKCTGNLTVAGGLAIQGAGGAASSIQGSFAITGPSLTHNGKNIGSTHTHGNVQPGGGTSGSPV